MPGWVAVAGTFALSAVSAYVFLRLSCRKSGNPFGRRAKWWAMTVIVLTAIVSTGVSVAAVALSDHARAALLGLVIPSGLWIGQASSQRSLGRTSTMLRSVVSCATFPLRRLYDTMGDDMQEWCDTRRDAASRTPERVAAAAQYYYNQVAGRLKDSQARAPLDRWKESIDHKIHVIQLINLDTTQARLHASLQWHRSTQDYVKFAGDPRGLAQRLQSDAQNELHLFLAHVYRLGYHNLLIYPMRPSTAPHGRRHHAGRQ
jgi:hypothetical protein